MSSLHPSRLHLARRLRPVMVALWMTSTLVTGAHSVQAQAPAQVDPRVRSAARRLGAEGIGLYRRGDYATALDRFERAYKLMAVPTLGVRSARCLVKLGRLVEASERYLEVTRLPLGRVAAWVHRKAQRDAGRERDALLPRIGSLEVRIEGPRGEGLRVWVDEDRVPDELVGTFFPADPGEHRVRAVRADTQVVEATTVPEGGRMTAVLRMPPLPAPPPTPPAAAAPPNGGVDWRAWTWVAFGIGAGGATAAAINGGIALEQQSNLEQRCPARVCPPEAHGAADVYDATRAATTAGMVIGGVGLATSLVLWLAAPDPPAGGRSTDARRRQWVAPSAVVWSF